MTKNKFKYETDLSKVVIGETYPFHLMITKVLEDSADSIVVVLNYVIKGTINKPTSEYRKVIYDRLLEAGIFFSEVRSMNDTHTVLPDPEGDFVYNSDTKFQMELNIRTIVYGRKKFLNEGEQPKTEKYALQGNKKISLENVSEEEQENLIEHMIQKLEVGRLSETTNTNPPAITEELIANSVGLVDKLSASFVELEHSIDATVKVLKAKDNVPADVWTRVECYREMVGKQKAMIPGLKDALLNKDYKSVGTYVQKINALSSMIRDDARDILVGKVVNEEDLQ